MSDATAPYDEQLRTYGHNEWKLWHAISAGSKPRYRWQNSWKDDPTGDSYPDIIGFDQQVPIGRVFQVPAMIDKDIWFWILYGCERRKRERPTHGCGWERSMTGAVLRVEWCYDRLQKEDVGG